MIRTPRYSLRVPQAIDPDAVPADMLALATDLDNNVQGYSQGTLASRPAAGVTGREYRATDTGFTYLDVGTAWVISARPIADVPGVLAYNAAWPSSPVDGQETDRFSDTTSQEIWRFRYNAAGAAGYRWQFISGAPLRQTGRFVALNNGNAVSLANNSITLGIAGIFLVTFSQLYGPTTYPAGNIVVSTSSTTPISLATFNSTAVANLTGAQISTPSLPSGGAFFGDISCAIDFTSFVGVALMPYWYQPSGAAGSPFVDTWYRPLRCG
jgi:hypothetical protein